MDISKLTDGIQTIAILCNQWGDTGKGKFSDYFAANWADVIARGTGGNNAGHTVVINGRKRIFHLIPAGIIYDTKINILGNGMVIDLEVLCNELSDLESENIPYNNLMVSQDAHCIMPYHIARDKSQNTSLAGSIGSTGRGIGPCYADKIARAGIKIKDLYNPDVFQKKLLAAKSSYPEQDISPEKIIESINPYAQKIKPFVSDTIAQIHSLKKQGKKILLEGAQGLLLSIEYGTYPYVTSSDCSLNGTSAGVGLSAKEVDLALGIVKFPYMTRVGAGPFPTELGGAKSENYCAKGLEHSLREELKTYDIPFNEISGKFSYDHKDSKIIELMNSRDEFLQGIGVRLAGEEYGATTGRPRRTGWTDLEALKYAVNINGPDIVLTKVDAICGLKEIKFASGYELGVGFARDCEELNKCKPIYQTFPGFCEDISNLHNFSDLPKGVLSGIMYLEKLTGARVRIVSCGPEQSQTIIK